jgi:hypothetical protein
MSAVVVFEGVELAPVADAMHEWTITTKEVAKSLGVTPAAVRACKSRNVLELKEGKHFLSSVTSRNAVHTQPSTVWTKRGVVRLGFLINSDRARMFRDFAEDLVLEKIEGAQPSIDMAALATAVATAVVSAFAPILAQLVGNQTPQQPALSGPTGLVDSGDAPMLEAAEIGDIVGMNPGSVNAMLARYGYQRLAGKSWVPTEFGRPFARTQNGTRSGVMYTYLVWSMDVIGRIFPESRMA